MLDFRHRFHGYNALRFVYKNGRATRNEFFTVKYVANPRRKTPRVAVVIGKKVLKSAVGRNRVRRRVYEIFREHLDALPPSTDIVCIIVSSEVRTMPTKTLKKYISESLQTIREK